MQAALTTSSCFSAQLQSSRKIHSTRSVRRTALARPVVMIGSINDPEKTKDEKERKAKDSVWAEPRNNNPLEKKNLMRDNPEGTTDSQEADREVAAEEIKQKGIDGLSGVQKAADDVVEGVKKAVSGDK